MILLRLVAVAVDHARRRWPLALVAAATASLAAGGVVYLIGDSAFRNEALVRSLRSPTVRSITIRANGDKPELLLPGAAVRNLAQLSGVERAVAFSKVRSATVVGFGDSDVSVGYFAMVTLRGDDPFQLLGGRSPRAEEVVASRSAAAQLRLTQPSAGAVRVGDEILPVVGSYDASGLGGITELLDHSVFTPAPADAAAYFSLVLLVREPSDVPVVVEAARLLLGPQGVESYTVDFDDRGAATEALVAQAGNSSVRSTAVGIVLVCALIEMIVAFLNALLQRREIARRRALGYSRGQVLGTLLLEGTIVAALGGLGGMAAAMAILSGRGQPVQLGQPLATVAFVTLIAAVSTLPGGALGAFQDPAQILRVP